MLSLSEYICVVVMGAIIITLLISIPIIYYASKPIVVYTNTGEKVVIDPNSIVYTVRNNEQCKIGLISGSFVIVNIKQCEGL